MIRTPLNQEQGFSLISLLIGVVISMIAILGMMSIFSTTVHSTAQAARDARITGERSTGLLVASSRLQEAGYGIADVSRNSHLLLLANAQITEPPNVAKGTQATLTGSKVSGAGQGNALVWQWRDGAQDRCSGLYAPVGADEGGLYELVVKDCSSVDAALTTTWETRRLIYDKKDIQDPLEVSISLTEFTSAPGCHGFGIAGQGGVRVTLSAKEPSGTDLNSSTCLLNFPVP